MLTRVFSYEKYQELFPYMENIHIVLKGSAGLINGIVWISSSVVRTEVDALCGRGGPLKDGLLKGIDEQ